MRSLFRYVLRSVFVLPVFIYLVGVVRSLASFFFYLDVRFFTYGVSSSVSFVFRSVGM